MNVLHEIFGQGTGWVEAFAGQMPQINARYDELLADIWSRGFLSKKYKLLVLTGVCLAQGRSEMIKQILSAAPEHASVSKPELLEIVSAVLLSRGPIAAFTAREAGILTGEQGVELPAGTAETTTNRKELLEYFRINMGEVPAWIRLLDEALPKGLEQYYALRNSVLIDSVLPRKIKELTLVAVNAAGLYSGGLSIHATGFMNAGGTREELLEGLLLAFIGGGIVAWLEGVRVLTEASLL